jgi:hypothetical protein
MAKLKDLLGKTLTKVEQIGDNELVFITNEGKRYKLYHEQDCCEGVAIESVVGDLSDLVGTPLLMAEESTSGVHAQRVCRCALVRRVKRLLQRKRVV